MSSKRNTGIAFLKAPDTTAEEIAAALAQGHPPFGQGSVQCDLVTCEECWRAWLTTGRPPVPKKKKPGPSPSKAQS